MEVEGECDRVLFSMPESWLSSGERIVRISSLVEF